MLTWWRRCKERQQQVIRDADNLMALYGDGPIRRAAQQAALEGFDEIASKLIANLEDYAGRASTPIKHAAESSGTTLETMKDHIKTLSGAR